jgi:hypothetical protein
LRDLKFTATDHNVKAEFTPGDNCTPPSAKFLGFDENYIADHLHIHLGCEHLVDGQGCDAELHIVYFSENTTVPSSDPSTVKAAVIGLRIEKDATEPHEGMQACRGYFIVSPRADMISLISAARRGNVMLHICL